jgi:hypothetical protein
MPNDITYCSVFPEDAVFGAIINSFQFRWTSSYIANPEYEHEDMLKAVLHALASFVSNEILFLLCQPLLIPTIIGSPSEAIETYLPSSVSSLAT